MSILRCEAQRHSKTVSNDFAVSLEMPGLHEGEVPTAFFQALLSQNGGLMLGKKDSCKSGQFWKLWEYDPATNSRSDRWVMVQVTSITPQSGGYILIERTVVDRSAPKLKL